MIREPILLDLPDVIETDRLIVRPSRAGDGQLLYDATMDSLDALRAFPASGKWATEEPSVTALEIGARRGQADFILRRDFQFLMLLKNEETLVGFVALNRLDWKVPKCSIGWWGRTGYLGRGLVTEGVAAILEFALSSLGTRRVEAYTDDANTRSCRMCERLGMQLEGVLRHERVEPDGTPRNTRIYAKIKPISQ